MTYPTEDATYGALKQQGQIYHCEASSRAKFSDYYLALLAVLLAGYALIGKPFAYLGISPLYIGEIVLILGVIVLLRSRCFVATLATFPYVPLGLLICWVILRTFPYLGEYGFDALRDTVIVTYSGYALITTALLLEKPERLQFTISFLRGLSKILVLFAPIALAVSDQGQYAKSAEDLPFIFAKAGSMCVHLSAAALLVLLGFMRARTAWLVVLLIGLLLAMSQGRGGMLAAMAMLAVATVASGKLRQVAPFLVIVGVVLGLSYAMDLSITTNRGRDVSAKQLVDNVVGVLGDAHDETDGTKGWRLQWWGAIIDYTFNGPYFWSGKGFGVNLTVSDGFAFGDLTTTTRSPHNTQFTILARGGVPGLVLWIVTLASWGLVLLANMVRARLNGDHAWYNLFLFVFCYVLGFIVDAAFDVELEGPMAGIWFWCLFGLGVGATMIYRAELSHRDPDVQSIEAVRADGSGD